MYPPIGKKIIHNICDYKKQNTQLKKKIVREKRLISKLAFISGIIIFLIKPKKKAKVLTSIFLTFPLLLFFFSPMLSYLTRIMTKKC